MSNQDPDPKILAPDTGAASPRGEETVVKEPFPQAEVREGTHPALRQLAAVVRSYWWALTAAALFALALVVMSWWSQGPVIRIHFEEGHGIKPGDALLHRGIEVGRVEVVQLKAGGQGVYLDVRLARKSRQLAREKTQFWIERPQVRLARVRGLETVVGAKYLAVLPGPEGGNLKREFQGSETPIWLEDAGETELIIDFRRGHGLEIGDPMRYRGVDVGEVMEIALSDELQRVRIRVRLTQSGTRVARAGSQFWIEHPEVSLAGVRGLETLVGGRYVAVIPGPAADEPQRHFVGLEDPPAARDRSPDGLEILLTSSHRRGLKRGVSVTYRGLPIGSVISVGMAADALTVEARVYIQPQFKHLVRQGSKFWNTGGVRLKAGVSGVDFRLDSMESLLRGGISMATPDDLGEPVTTGYRFEFYDEPEKAWLEWRPRIAVGAALLPPDRRLPIALRVQLRWEASRLGFRRTERMMGWILPLESGNLVGLADVLAPPDDKRETAVLEIEGREFPVQSAQVTTAAGVGVASLPEFRAEQTAWPNERIRIPNQPEDCLVVAGDAGAQLPLAAGRLEAVDGGWSIDKSLSFDETDWHGACVVAASDGILVGLLRVEKRTGSVLFLPPDLPAP